MSEVYILAVSGGVDSVVLLHWIVQHAADPQSLTTNPQPPLYIVAHVDHGIRADSAKDAKFVENLAKAYGLAFVSKSLKLGKDASENEARDARYEFLFEVKKKYSAEAIITAHHQDDVLETMIVNMIRGTGPRGLVGFSRPHILRPFIDKTKVELLTYAQQNNLKWREDSTNQDITYMRNYVRTKFMPNLKAKDRQKLLKIRKSLSELYLEIDDSTKKLLVQTLIKGELSRSRFVVLPYIIQKELVACWLRLNGVTIHRKMVEKAVIATKTMLPNKTVELSIEVSLVITKETIVFKNALSGNV